MIATTLARWTRLAALLGLAIPSLAGLAGGLVVVSTAAAQEVSVGLGSSLSLGSGSLELGCGDLRVEGVVDNQAGNIQHARDVILLPGSALNGGTGVINLTRNWNNAGSFTAGTGSVNLVDGCSATDASILGSNSFYRLSVTTSSGRTLALEAGLTQTVTSSLTLAGVAGNPLVLRSTSAGSEAEISAPASVSVAFLDVDDVHAFPTPLEVGSGSILGLNTTGWSYLGLAVPSFSLVGALLLVAGMIASARKRLTPNL